VRGPRKSIFTFRITFGSTDLIAEPLNVLSISKLRLESKPPGDVSILFIQKILMENFLNLLDFSAGLTPTFFHVTLLLPLR